MLNPDFKPGDRVQFCAEKATVIENRGDYGIVRGDGATHNSRWDWFFEGHQVTHVEEIDVSAVVL